MRALRRIAALPVLMAAAALPALAALWRPPHAHAPAPAAPAPQPRLLGICSLPDAYALAFSPDGQYLAVGCGTLTTSTSVGQLKVWRLATGEIVRSVAYPRPVSQLTFSPDGKSIAVSTIDSIVRIWQWQTGATLATIRLPGAAWGLRTAYAQNVPLFAVGGGDQGTGGRPGTVALYDTRTWQTLWTATIPNETVFDLAFIPDDHGVVCVSRRLTPATGRVLLLDTHGGHVLWSRPDADVSGCAVIPTLDAIFEVDSVQVGSADKLQVRTMTTRGGVPGRKYFATMGQYAFTAGQRGTTSALGGLLAVDGATMSTVAVRVARTGAPLMTLQALSAPPRAYALAPGGSELAAGGSDGSVTIWTLR